MLKGKPSWKLNLPLENEFCGNLMLEALDLYNNAMGAVHNLLNDKAAKKECEKIMMYCMDYTQYIIDSHSGGSSSRIEICYEEDEE